MTSKTGSTNGTNGAVHSLPLAERRIRSLASSIGGFAGLGPGGPVDRALRCTSFEEFAAAYADPKSPAAGAFLPDAKLAHCVRGFFRNGGRICWVVRVDGAPGASEVSAHVDALRLLEDLDEPTLIAAPDAYATATGADGAAAVQRALVAGCERVVGRFALVDPPRRLDTAGALQWRTASPLDSAVAASYHPWVEVGDPCSGCTIAVPPCGHAAGMLARVDARQGMHRAPTAEPLLATDGPASELTAAEQHRLNRAGLNCLRAWPGPELRAWGACTLASDPERRYLHHQRIVGHLTASVAEGTRWAAEQEHDERLYEQLRATVTAFLAAEWRGGLLQGETRSQAFAVRCDDELNAAAAHAPGEVIVEIGLAVRRAGEFRVMRIAHGTPQT